MIIERRALQPSGSCANLTWFILARFLVPSVSGKVEKILKGSLDLIPSPSVKIQIMGGKVYLRCKGKTLLVVV